MGHPPNTITVTRCLDFDHARSRRSGARVGVVSCVGAFQAGKVNIFPFARHDGRHVDKFGSSFVLSPLTDPLGEARVACFHLGPGELVGEHEAVLGQLFCVVDGRGWVSGDDGVPVAIAAQQAAYWVVGERHAAGTDSAMTAIGLEGNDFTVAAGEVFP